MKMVFFSQLKNPTIKNAPDCDTCGKPMTLKQSRRGPFLACTGYPECKNTMDCRTDENGELQAVPKAKLLEEVDCRACEKPMTIKHGFRGPFLACTGYPDCRETLDVKIDDKGIVQPIFPAIGEKDSPDTQNSSDSSNISDEKTDSKSTVKSPPRAKSRAIPAPPEIKCDNCGGPMLVRRGRYGPFFSCAAFPECKSIKKIPKGMDIELPPPPERAKPIPTDVECENCGKPMVIRKSRRGPFLGCSAYPKCKTAIPLPDNLKEKAAELAS